MHTFMIPVAVVAAVVLVVAGRSTAARVAAAVTGLANLFMFVTSSIFNRRWWSDDAWRVMRQVDQTAIYVLIGGTFTGLIAVAPDGAIRVWRMLLMWSLVLAGIALRWAPFELPHGLQSGLFVVLGLVGGLNAFLVFEEVSYSAGWLMVAGGVCYIGGVIVLGLRRPDPWPSRFGYHEIWHVLVVIGVSVHYVAVMDVVS
jgi:hemolysin III